MKVKSIELKETIMLGTVAMTQPVCIDVIKSQVRQMIREDYGKFIVCWFCADGSPVAAAEDVSYHVEFTQNDCDRIECIVLKKVYDVTVKEG